MFISRAWMASSLILRSFLVNSLLVILVNGTGTVKEPAWNGHTTPDATTPSSFTSYYVPPGAKSYDSTSPLIHYSGKWIEYFSPGYISGSIRRTSIVGASAKFIFN